MMSSLRHAYRVARTQLREHVVKGIIHPIIGKRSSAWRGTRKRFIELNSTCAACGGTSFLNVHHKEPYHLEPKLELEPSNLITLCMGKFECHLMLGHGDDFKAYNRDVAHHAAMTLKNPAVRPQMEALAKALRQYG